MPINLYVTPVTGTPHWWCATDSDGLTFGGAFPWAARGQPDDAARLQGYRLGLGEETPLWRVATRDEAVGALWNALHEGD